MRDGRIYGICLNGLACLMALQTNGQVPFDLDTSYVTELQAKYINSVLVLEDGRLLISGNLAFPGDNPLQPRWGARLEVDGTRDLSFNPYPGMGGTLTPWNDQFYSGAGQLVRRLNMDGTYDPTFISMNDGPYFTSLQGGDYHVYPDGRVLMSGAHMLDDPIRGFQGLYSLIWFSNTGYLDTTRTHRLCNGVIYEIEEQPDGKFLCTGTMTTYEGQAVSRVFRVEADGSLDPSFSAPLQDIGVARDYHTLSDGRIMIGGSCRLIGSEQVRSLIRLHADGTLDESFNLLNFQATFTPSEIPNVNSIYELTPDRYIIAGFFDKINGLDRGGIAMIDSNGNLLDEAFDGLGCGAYDFASPSGTTTYKSIAGIVPSSDGNYYIWGAYHGYDDGTTNDTTQRMVSRLYGLEVGVREVELEGISASLHVYPNPANKFANVVVGLGSDPEQAELVVQDMAGREMHRHAVQQKDQQVLLDTRDWSNGAYTIRLVDGSSVLKVERLVIER